MNAFIDLKLEDQAAVVLIQLLDDVVNGRKTMAAIEHHMGDLYNLLGAEFDCSAKEVATVTAAVAKYGIRMLPGYKEEDEDGGRGPDEGGGEVAVGDTKRTTSEVRVDGVGS